jgi:hypothetical protein
MLPLFNPTSRSDLQISGTSTVAEWNAHRPALGDAPPETWHRTFDQFLGGRLRLRYLDPITTLQDSGSYRGEGFSIVTIQVALIEFLAATVSGLSYRLVKRGEPPLGQFEYSQSGTLFSGFLESQAPFQVDFPGDAADQFYKNVRCGLLHEARTKQSWSIWAASGQGQIVDAVRKIVFRDDLQNALLQFIAQYRARLGADQDIQEAFVRKIDSLCVE